MIHTSSFSKGKTMKILKTLLLSLAALVSPISYAEVQFNKPITIVVAFPPGGEVDVIARILAEKLAPRIGQSVVVLNKPGASSSIGSRFVAESKPDGTTLLLAPSTLVTSQLVLKNLVSYDVKKDFTPIVEVTKNSVLFLAVRPSLGVKDHKGLLEKIKSGEIKTYATPGNGSPMNMIGEYYKNQTGANLTQVAYKGNPPAVRGFLAGEVDILIGGALTMAPLLKDNKVVLIGGASAERSKFYPQIPTLAEQGLAPANFSGWMALFGPAKMDQKVVNALNNHVNAIIKSPEVSKKLLANYSIPAGGSPEDMRKSLNDLYQRFDYNLKNFNIKINVQ